MFEKKLDIGLGISQMIEFGKVSPIDDINVPFKHYISLESLGLSDIEIKSPNTIIEGKILTSVLTKLPFFRKFDLNKNLDQLSIDDSTILKNKLRFYIKNHFDNVYQVIEERHEFIVSGFVYNTVNYMCYGYKKIEWV